MTTINEATEAPTKSPRPDDMDVRIRQFDSAELWDPETSLVDDADFDPDSPLQSQLVSYYIAREHGWWDRPEDRNIPTKLMLTVSELSEALEEFREGALLTTVTWEEKEDGTWKPIGFAIELADAIIRLQDLASRYGIDLEKTVRIKQEYNRTRPFRHGGKAV